MGEASTRSFNAVKRGGLIAWPKLLGAGNKVLTENVVGVRLYVSRGLLAVGSCYE